LAINKNRKGSKAEENKGNAKCRIVCEMKKETNEMPLKGQKKCHSH
jgi:hypothetical protein